MPYLIDGHNLIPRIPGLSLQDVDDEIKLIKTLQNFCRQAGKRVEVYFDNAPPGGPGTRKHGRVTAHFIRQGRSADAAMRARLRRLGASARNYTVVTSDQEVAVFARAAGAQVISAEQFSKELLQKSEPERPAPGMDPDLSLDQDNLKEWMRLFGIDHEED